MARTRRSKYNNRSQAGRLDIVIITVIALLLIAGFAYVIFQIVGHSEEHVDTVRKTKILYKESLRYRPDSDLCEARIRQDLIKFPDRKNGVYSDVNLNEKSVKLISQMTKLEKLDLDRSTLRDQWLSYLTGLPLLANLSIEGTAITDRAIPYTLKMPHLQRLSIGDSEVGDKGIEMLSAHPNLTNLALNLCRSVTNDGIKSVCNIKHLKHLELANPVSLTGECLPNLKNAKQLAELSLESMSVTPEDLKSLVELRNLTTLDLTNCQLKDDSIAEISKIGSLRILNLTGNDLTEDGLMSLTKLKKLTALRLKGCSHLDDKMVANFHSAMPKTLVHFSVSSDMSDKMSRTDVKQSVDFLQNEVKQELEKVRSGEIDDSL